MRILSIILLSAFCLFQGLPTGWACGLCHEDDRSAVYSYEADQKAKAQPQMLEFAVFKIIGPVSVSTVTSLTNYLKEQKGIDGSTVRVSQSQKSMGFVMERALNKEQLIRDLEAKFPDLKIHSLIYPR